MGEKTKKSLKVKKENNDNLENIVDDSIEKNNEELKELLKKNIEISEEILGATKRIKKYVLMQRVWGWFKILIIVAPIIIAAMYLKSLTPVLKEVYGQYQRMMGITEQLNNTPINQELLNGSILK